MTDKLLLAMDFAKRDFKERYVGTGLGQLWYILSPIITIFIYTVIFSDFMKMKLDIVDNSYAYSIYLVPGLLAWTSFSTILMRLNNSISEKSNLIKKLNVPLYVYQVAIIITEFGILMLSYVFALVFLLLIDHPITLSFIFLVPVLFLQTIFAFSLGVIVSLFNPFLKDLKEAVPIIVQLWFWMTPIIYMKEMIADKYPSILILNPFYYFVQIYQDIFLYSKVPPMSLVVNIVIITLAAISVAGLLYKKMISAIKDTI